MLDLYEIVPNTSVTRSVLYRSWVRVHNLLVKGLPLNSGDKRVHSKMVKYGYNELMTKETRVGNKIKFKKDVKKYYNITIEWYDRYFSPFSNYYLYYIFDNFKLYVGETNICIYLNKGVQSITNDELKFIHPFIEYHTNINRKTNFQIIKEHKQYSC